MDFFLDLLRRLLVLVISILALLLLISLGSFLVKQSVALSVKVLSYFLS